MPPLPGVLPIVAPSQSPPQPSVETSNETTVTSTIANFTTAKTMTVQSETVPVTSCSTTASIGASSATADVASCSSSSITAQSSTLATGTDKNHSSRSKGSSSSNISSAGSSSETAESDHAQENETESSDAEKSASTDSETKDEADSSVVCLDNPRRIFLKSVNPHIICNLCKGYLIDATTIVECLHSFCHSCIMKHLRTEQYCPRCEMMINTAKPNIKLDTTLQAIVYKLVPGLYEKELMRKRAFYRDRPEEARLATPEQRGEDTEHLIFGPNENMSLSLEYADLEDIPEHDKTGLRTPKYLQCPASFTVAHLKKFVLLKFGINSRYFFVEIMYKVKTIVLSDHDTLMDVAYIYTWKRDAPMKFFFRVKENENAMELRRKMIEDNLKKKGEKRDQFPVKTEQNEEKKTEDPESYGGNESDESTVKENAPEKTEPVKDGPKETDSIAHLDISTAKEENADSKKTKCKLPLDEVQSEECKKSEKETVLSNSEDLSKTVQKTVNEKEKATTSPRFQKDDEKEKGNKTPKHTSSSSDHSPEKIKITLVSKPCKQSRNSPGSSPRDEDRFTKSSSKERSPKHENIKLKIDLSNRKSFTIINMPGIKNDREEVVNSDKPEKHEKEWKLKSKKDKDDKSKSPKSSPENKHQRFEIKNSSPSDSKSTVPPITIKAERKSPSSKNSESFPPSFSIKQELKKPEVDCDKEREKDEEEKKSEFLNSIALTPIKHSTSPDKTKITHPKIPNPPVFGTSPVLLAPLVAKPPTSSKRKNKESSTKTAKKAKVEALSLPIIDAEETKTKDGNTGTAKSSIPFKPASFSFQEDLAKKQVEDNKLMPAPPPLKVIDLKFKKNGMKPPKPPKGAKALSSSKQKPVNFNSRITAPPGSLTPHPSFPTGIATAKVPVQPSAPGCRTPVARRYPPILPKSPRPNPFANIPNDVNKMLQNTGTEIKQISNGTGKDVKVYGPSMATTSANAKVDITPPSLNTMASSPPSRSSAKGQNNSSYLNYALFNASRAKLSDVPLGCRTPIYTPNSPIYSPSSPQYMPNYNIPAKPTYKYTKSASSSSNFLNNVLDKQLSSLFPAPPVKKPPESLVMPATSSNSSNNNKTSPLPLVSDCKKIEENPLKRSYPFSKSPPMSNVPSVKTEEPPEKQTKVQSLLNSCNISIPSSLSITITNEDGDPNVNNSSNMKLNNPVNNYIEILKLPDSQPVSPEKGDLKKSPSPPRSQSQSSRPLDMKETATPTTLGNGVSRVNIPRSSPSQVQSSNTSSSLVSSSNSPTKQIPSLNPIDKKQAQFENSANPPNTGKIKKTQSPEKKPSEKTSQKKSASEKKVSGESAPPQKGTKQSADAATTQPSKKFRHILPRTTTTTPKAKDTSAAESAKLNLLANAFLSNLPSNSKASKKTNNNNNNKRTEPPPIDLLAQKQKTCNSPKTSPTSSSTTNQPPPDITSFISETLLRAQQQAAATNSNGVYLPHLAAAANFNPHFASVNFGYNLQQAYLMEHISRMQKAGHEALEKYMQKLKGVNSAAPTSPNSSKDK